MSQEDEPQNNVCNGVTIRRRRIKRTLITDVIQDESLIVWAFDSTLI